MSTEEKLKVLVIDDEPFMLPLFETVLGEKGYDVQTTMKGKEGIEIAKRGDIDVVVSDLKMPDISGIEVLEAVREHASDVGVVLMTGYGTLETAVNALRLNADDYLLKPFEDFEGTVTKVIARVGEKRRLAKENRKLSAELREVNQRLKKSNSELRGMVAQMTALQRTNQMINGCSDTETILELVGEGLSGGFDAAGFLIALANDMSWHEPVRWHGLSSDEARSFMYTPGEGPIGKAVAAALPAIVEIAEPGEDRSKRVMVMPLLASGEVIGSLIVTQLQGENQIDDEALNLFSVIAAQLSAPLALTNMKAQSQKKTTL
jgi:DNA-binding response OmpR family regulator